MGEIIQDVLLLVMLAIGNGVFAMSEIAIVSARTARLEQQANEGQTGSQAALELASDPGQFLSTVQVGITLVGILSGAFGATTLGLKLGDELARFPILEPYGDALGIGIIVVSMTYLSLIVGELVPKRIALSNPEGISATIARPMQMLARITRPVVSFLSSSTDAVASLLGVQDDERPPVTEDEIRVLLRRGQEVGIVEEKERTVIHRAFQLTDRRVGSILTPRPDIVWLDLEQSAEETKQRIIASVHTRFPVCRGGLDDVAGIVTAKDLLAQILRGEPIDLKALMKPPKFVPESMPAFDVLEAFEEGGMHIALVMDEYGGLEGLVTTNDILDALVGDVPSPEDQPYQVKRREDGTWLIDGMLPVQEFRDMFGMQRFPGEARALYETIGGFVMNHLERIPQAGDRFELRGYGFEVVDMDGLRVDKILITPPGGESAVSDS